MADPNNSTVVATISTNHTTAEFGGITGLAGAPSLPGNIPSWSRKSTQSALQAGAITSAQHFQVMKQIDMWEQCQAGNALDSNSLRGTYVGR